MTSKAIRIRRLAAGHANIVTEQELFAPRHALRKVLLIAYEYPPIPAAQSLRWFYFANALAETGCHEIHVVSPAIRDVWGFSGKLHPAVVVHRVFPGPFVASCGWLAKCGVSSGEELPDPETAPMPLRGLPKGIYMLVRRALNQVLFPDVRTEWLPFAWRAIKRLCARERFEVFISSHEPGVDILLGRRLKRRYPTVPWIIDLADPLLAPYTPPWRRWLDARLERKVIEEADRVLVTNDTVRALLHQRYHLPRERIRVVTQGFAPNPLTQTEGVNKVPNTTLVPPDKFTLLFTGNFYPRFRDPSHLFAAVASLPELSLLVAGNVGSSLIKHSGIQNQIRVLGRIDHGRCLALQKEATVLVNLGNIQDYQIPGKLYEYLGAQRPILHIFQSPQDEIIRLIRNLGRGEVTENRPDSIADSLRQLYKLWEAGTLEYHYDLSLASVEDFSWHCQAAKIFSDLNPGYRPQRKLASPCA